MKFTQNTPIVSPNTIGNVQVQAVRDPMAYGMGGKEYDAMAGAVGQMAKVAQKQQDDIDAADLMELRNKVMGSLTQNLYGENGVLTTGVGENAKGLQGRVTDVVQKTADTFSKQYNRRVQRAFRGTFSENMANYQRIAAQQEQREFKKQQESQYVLGVQNQTDLSMANYQDENILQSSINEGLRLADYRAHTMGYSEQQRQQERRNVITQIAGGAMEACIKNGDLETASIYNDRYGKYMDQKTALKYQQTLRQEKTIQDEKAEIDDILSKCRKPDGTIDRLAAMEEISRRAKLTKVVGGGGSGSYSGNKNIDSLIDKYAKEYNVPADLLAAMGEIESNFSMDAVSGVGALGIFQLMPDTAASLGVDPYSLEDNIKGGAKYLRQMLDAFGGDEDLAIAAYNAGPGAVKEYGGIPPYKETQNHVKKVKEAREKYKGYANIDISDLPQDQGMYDKGLTHTNNRLKKEYRDLFYWVKNETGKEMSINGGWRSKEYNASVNGADKSHHLTGDALDVDVSMLTPAEKDKVIEEAQRRGFNEDGDDFYHDKGSGYHLHLVYKDDGSGSGGGHTVNLHDSGYEDRMRRLLNARCQDEDFRLGEERKNKFEAYKQQVNGLGAAGSVELIQRLKDSNEDEGVVKSLASYINYKYDGVLNKGRGGGGGSRGGSGAGGRRTQGRVHGENGYYGKSGKWYTMAQYEKANDAAEEYKHLAELSEQGLYKIGDKQSYYNSQTAILNDIWDNNYTDNAMIVTKEVYSRAKGDLYGAIRILQEEYGMAQDEAARYVNHYLGMQSDDE